MGNWLELKLGLELGDRAGARLGLRTCVVRNITFTRDYIGIEPHPRILSNVIFSQKSSNTTASLHGSLGFIILVIRFEPLRKCINLSLLNCAK